MKKVLSVIASVVLGCIFLAALGCSDKISSITDLKRYSDMQSEADKSTLSLIMAHKTAISLR